MGAVIRILALLSIAAGGLCAQSVGFWEPELPRDQSFFTLWRSIKTFALARYDIVQDGERYPATELTVELTHGVVHFFHVGPSKGRKEPLSLKEIADGKFAEGNRLERFIPGKEPPKKLTIRGPDPLRHVRFSIATSEEVESLYRELYQKFKTAFPW